MLDSKKLLPRRSSSTRLSTDTMKNFVVIKTDLVKIDSLLKERLVLSKVRAGIEKQMMQNKKRKEREEELERKKQKAKDGDELQLNDDPKKKKGGLLGFLLGGLIAGVGALVIAALPMMVTIGKTIGKIARPIIQISTRIVDMLGSVVNTTFRGIKNLKENFQLDAIDKIPAVAESIGVGIATLVAGLGAAALFNTASGVIGAKSIKDIVKAVKQQKTITPSVSGGALMKTQTSALRKIPTAKSIVPVTTSFESIGGKSVRLVEQIAQEATTMPFMDIMALKVSGLGFSRGDLLTNVFRLAGYKDDFIMEFLADLFEEQIIDDLSNQEYIENFFKDKGGVFENLKKNIDKGIDYNKIIDNLPPTFAPTGSPNSNSLKASLKQFIADVKATDLDVLQGKKPRITSNIISPVPLGKKAISGTGGDAGAIGRNLLQTKKLLAETDQAGALARQVLRNKKATRIVSRPILKKFMKTTRQILSPIPLLGDLAILLLDIFVFGEIPARAGFKTIGSILGSLIGGLIGSLAPGPGTIAGAIIGGIAGDVIGAFVYDMLDIASVAQEAIKIDDTKDLGKSDLIRAGASGAVDFVTVKDLGGVIRKGMTFKNAENKDEFLFEGDLFQAAKDEGFGRDFQIANSLQGKRGFEYLRQRLSYERRRKSRTRFIPLGGGVQQVVMNKGEAVTQVIAAPDPSSFFESFNKQILYKRGC